MLDKQQWRAGSQVIAIEERIWKLSDDEAFVR
jgi:hypothetical protein